MARRGRGGGGGERTETRGEDVGDLDRLRALAAELAISDENERRRIASGLHDQVGQMLGIAKVKLGEALAAAPADEVAALVSEGRRLVDLAIREIRALTFELSSPVLHELGLEAALKSLAERMTERHGIPCSFEPAGQPLAVSEESAVLLHAIVSELLWNVVKHARASRVRLAIGRDEDRMWVKVHDDGVGFDGAVAFDRTGPNAGYGLLSGRERMGHLGGTLEVESAPGQGTRILLTVPLDR